MSGIRTLPEKEAVDLVTRVIRGQRRAPVAVQVQAALKVLELGAAARRDDGGGQDQAPALQILAALRARAATAVTVAPTVDRGGRVLEQRRGDHIPQVPADLDLEQPAAPIVPESGGAGGALQAERQPDSLSDGAEVAGPNGST